MCSMHVSRRYIFFFFLNSRRISIKLTMRKGGASAMGIANPTTTTIYKNNIVRLVCTNESAPEGHVQSHYTP